MPDTSTVAGQSFTFDRNAVEGAVEGVLPEPIRSHYVVVRGRRYPPKQVVALLTGLDRADFTTHHARRLLQRLGLTVGRTGEPSRAAGPVDRRDWPHGGREADLLRPYRGQWVAQRGLDVLVAADAPQLVVEWLQRHGVRDATVFGVPVTEQELEISLWR